MTFAKVCFADGTIHHFFIPLTMFDPIHETPYEYAALVMDYFANLGYKVKFVTTV